MLYLFGESYHFFLLYFYLFHFYFAKKKLQTTYTMYDGIILMINECFNSLLLWLSASFTLILPLSQNCSINLKLFQVQYWQYQLTVVAYDLFFHIDFFFNFIFMDASLKIIIKFSLHKKTKNISKFHSQIMQLLQSR